MSATPAQHAPLAAFLVPALLNAGAERQLLATADLFGARGWRTLLMTYDENDPRFAEVAKRHELVELPRGGGAIALIRRLRSVLVEHQASVLHVHLVTAQAYALLLRVAGWRGHLVFGIRDSLPLFYHRDLKSIVADALVFNPFLAADAYVFNSIEGLRRKGRFLRRTRCHVVGNIIDTSRFHPSASGADVLRRLLHLPADSLVVGRVANFSGYKDFATFFGAAARVLDELPNVYFVLIGDSESPEGRDAMIAVQSSAFAERFHFLGSRMDVDQLMQGMDVLCSSSTTEGFSSVIAEALACAVPCVVTDAGDSARIVGDAGLILPVRAPEAMGDALLALLRLPRAERFALGIRGRDRMVAEFSAAAIGERLEQIYRTLGVAQPRSSSAPTV